VRMCYHWLGRTNQLIGRENNSQKLAEIGWSPIFEIEDWVHLALASDTPPPLSLLGNTKKQKRKSARNHQNNMITTSELEVKSHHAAKTIQKMWKRNHQKGESISGEVLIPSEASNSLDNNLESLNQNEMSVPSSQNTKEESMAQDMASRLIQRAFRSRKVREEEGEAAVKVQKMFRGRLARNSFRMVLSMRRNKHTCIQIGDTLKSHISLLIAFKLQERLIERCLEALSFLMIHNSTEFLISCNDIQNDLEEEIDTSLVGEEEILQSPEKKEKHPRHISFKLAASMIQKLRSRSTKASRKLNPRSSDSPTSPFSFMKSKSLIQLQTQEAEEEDKEKAVVFTDLIHEAVDLSLIFSSLHEELEFYMVEVVEGEIIPSLDEMQRMWRAFSTYSFPLPISMSDRISDISHEIIELLFDWINENASWLDLSLGNMVEVFSSFFDQKGHVIGQKLIETVREIFTQDQKTMGDEGWDVLIVQEKILSSFGENLVFSISEAFGCYGEEGCAWNLSSSCLSSTSSSSKVGMTNGYFSFLNTTLHFVEPMGLHMQDLWAGVNSHHPFIVREAKKLNKLKNCQAPLPTLISTLSSLHSSTTQSLSDHIRRDRKSLDLGGVDENRIPSLMCHLLGGVSSEIAKIL